MAAEYLQSENVNSRNAYLSFVSVISHSSVQKCINLPQKCYLHQENTMFSTVQVFRSIQPAFLSQR